MLLDKIRELNDKLYKMCGELHENKDFVGTYQDEVLSRIFKLYVFDYELISLGLIDEREERSELERRNELMTPSYKRVWYAPWKKKLNRAAELLEEEAMQNAKQYFDRKEEMLRQLEEAIKETDELNPAEAMEEPKMGEREEDADEEGVREQPDDEQGQEQS